MRALIGSCIYIFFYIMNAQIAVITMHCNDTYSAVISTRKLIIYISISIDVYTSSHCNIRPNNYYLKNISTRKWNLIIHYKTSSFSTDLITLIIASVNFSRFPRLFRVHILCRWTSSLVRRAAKRYIELIKGEAKRWEGARKLCARASRANSEIAIEKALPKANAPKYNPTYMHH